MMGWSKAALCSIGVMFFSGAAWAEKIQCPTTKKITLKVPASAKKCMAWFGDTKDDLYAGCE
ncbi:hypothetical protein [Cronobacter malonaticus]|uniref:hypothetical protein n=1 Tax=Cronobacter malonaticus TaxID=413503 RepID=UPI000CFC3A9C|nr:hypothetical protein [Cronobacter malonaticus]ELY5851828.1 hypothetical protein [Cronobacter malonaticus]WRU15072.1 hypothetical protein U9L39_03270 [Cronobacter malonaticus]